MPGDFQSNDEVPQFDGPVVQGGLHPLRLLLRLAPDLEGGRLETVAVRGGEPPRARVQVAVPEELHPGRLQVADGRGANGGHREARRPLRSNPESDGAVSVLGGAGAWGPLAASA